MRIQVRCCCNPDLVLGTLEVDAMPKFKETVLFPTGSGPLAFQYDQIRIVDSAGMRFEGAFKNKDYSASQLLRVSGFEPLLPKRKRRK